MKPLHCFLLVLVLTAVKAHANPATIYKWTDAQGATHYTSKKPYANAKPAKLPEIMRGDVKLVKRKLTSCANHGGIDCQAGPDKDGSVICYDGFRKADPRFRLSCSSPKLQISQVSEVTPEGQFTVVVRNSKSVEAKKPTVMFHPGSGKEFKLSGPAKIEPFGVGEFHFEPKDVDADFIRRASGKPLAQDGTANDTASGVAKVATTQLEISCANCS